jgi:hypothetical protein
MKDNIKKLSYIHMPMKREFGFEFSWKNAHKNRWKRMAPKNIPCAASTANRRKPQKIVWQAAKKQLRKKYSIKNPQSGRNTGSI